MSAVSAVSVRGARWCGALCVAVVLASSLSGCRPRSVANQNMPSIPPSSAAATEPATGSNSGSGQVGQVGQQDVDSLNGIIASVGGAVTSVRSAFGADSPTANR